MKLTLKLQMSFIIIFVCNVAFSQSMKGISLGDIYKGEKVIKTSVGGFEGIQSISTLNNGTVYSLHFKSSNVIKDETEYMLAQHFADDFKANVENNYAIKFDKGKWNHVEILRNQMFFDSMWKIEGDISYAISFNAKLDAGTSEYYLIITDESLANKAVLEINIKKRNDF